MTAPKLMLDAIKTRAVILRPYFARALFSLTFVFTEKVETMACDRYGRVYVNPTRIAGRGKTTWPIEQSTGALVHELQHVLRNHFERGDPYVKRAPPEERGLEQDFVNICQDAEINDDFTATDLPLPPNGVYPRTIGQPPGRLWEEYYKRVPRTARPKRSIPECGSCTGGGRRSYELPPPDGHSVPGLTEGDLVLVRRATAEAVRRAGNVPAGLRRWAEEFLGPPRVPWERELSALVHVAASAASGRTEHSYSRISRRWRPGDGVLRPAMVGPEIDLTVVVDTSGSMELVDADGRPLVAAAMNEIAGIAAAAGQRKVRVLCCDTDSYEVQHGSSLLDLQIVGGGGTDLRVGIAAAEALRSKVILVLTDGHTPWPDEAPKAELVVAIFGEEGASPGSVPPYVRRVVTVTGERPQDTAASG